MAKTRNEIYMNYQLLKEKANQLDELADQLEKTARDNLSVYSNDRSFWKGDSGDMCRQKIKKVEDNVMSRAKMLRKTAESIRTAARKQYQLEQTLISLVSKK